MIIFVNDMNGGTTRLEALSVVVEAAPNNILIEDQVEVYNSIKISNRGIFKNDFTIDISIPKS
jgi:hypothetical protein